MLPFLHMVIKSEGVCVRIAVCLSTRVFIVLEICMYVPSEIYAACKKYLE